jgi:hypothetical protein
MRCTRVDSGTYGTRVDAPCAAQVADIFCARCHAAVGWQYLCCYEASQQYKEGHVILEKVKLHRSWRDPPPAASRL